MRRTQSIVDIPVDIIEKLGTPLKEYANSSGEYQFNCVFCPKGDTKYHLYYNPSKKRFCCHRCDTAGTIRYLRKRLGLSVEGRPPVSAFNLAKSRFLGEVEDVEYPVIQEVDLSNTRPLQEGDYGWQYALSRGISPEQVRTYDIRCGTGKLANRLVFPEYDEQHKPIFYSARAYFDYMYPKYDNPKGTNKVLLLYNHRRASKFDEVIITEGVISCLVAGDNAVCLYGKVASIYQLELIDKYWDKAVIALDGDALENAISLAEELESLGLGVRVVSFRDGEDPASVGHAEFVERVEEAKPFSWRSIVKLKLRRFDNGNTNIFNSKDNRKAHKRRYSKVRVPGTF